MIKFALTSWSILYILLYIIMTLTEPFQFGLEKTETTHTPKEWLLNTLFNIPLIFILTYYLLH